jgi:hypothetical protein
MTFAGYKIKTINTKLGIQAKFLRRHRVKTMQKLDVIYKTINILLPKSIWPITTVWWKTRIADR